MKDDVVEGRTGVVTRSSDAPDLARALKAFFTSDMFADRERTRSIVRFVDARCSWEPISGTIADVNRTVQKQSDEGVLDKP